MEQLKEEWKERLVTQFPSLINEYETFLINSDNKEIPGSRKIVSIEDFIRTEIEAAEKIGRQSAFSQVRKKLSSDDFIRFIIAEVITYYNRYDIDFDANDWRDSIKNDLLSALQESSK